MTDPQPDKPARVAGQFVTMDAAMLAAQNQRLDQLNDSIEALVKSISNHPTKWDLDYARKRLRNQLFASVAVAGLLFGYSFLTQSRLTQACEDRNANALSFRVVITEVISSVAANPNTNSDKLEKSLITYLSTLKPIDC